MTIITFAGHRKVEEPETVRHWLYGTVTQLIENGTETFYLGGYGEFDEMAAQVVKEHKEKYPNIRSVLIVAYPNRKWDTELYDECLYPLTEKVTPRAAIPKRNEWMMKTADVVVSYITHVGGGAEKSVGIAKKAGKKIIPYLA